MLGFLLAFLAALSQSTRDVLNKTILSKDINEYVVAWAQCFFALPLLYSALLFTGIPTIGKNFWLAIFNTFEMFILLPFMLHRCSTLPKQQRLKKLYPLAIIGAATSFLHFFQMAAISLTLVPYVISIKRTSTIISTLAGEIHRVFEVHLDDLPPT
ncbi:MAG: hypothetical protein ABII72_05260 [Parcubacteria group bacterium]